MQKILNARWYQYDAKDIKYQVVPKLHKLSQSLVLRD